LKTKNSPPVVWVVCVAATSVIRNGVQQRNPQAGRSPCPPSRGRVVGTRRLHKKPRHRHPERQTREMEQDAASPSARRAPRQNVERSSGKCQMQREEAARGSSGETPVGTRQPCRMSRSTASQASARRPVCHRRAAPAVCGTRGSAASAVWRKGDGCCSTRQHKSAEPPALLSAV